MKVTTALLLICLAISSTSFAVEFGEFRLAGVVKRGVIVEYQGTPKLLRIGKSNRLGIKVISVQPPNIAVLEINGEQRELSVETQLMGNYAAPKLRVVKIPRSRNQHYLTQGSINGKGVMFLVDTGASHVAFSASTARRLGVDYSAGQEGMVQTAAGLAKAWQVSLTRVDVGAISVGNVSALVIEEGGPSEVLLGMSFLKRLEIQQSDGVLTLTQR